jgi:hypothetical protein
MIFECTFSTKISFLIHCLYTCVTSFNPLVGVLSSRSVEQTPFAAMNFFKIIFVKSKQGKNSIWFDLIQIILKITSNERLHVVVTE